MSAVGGGSRHLLRPLNGQYMQSKTQTYRTRKSHKKSKAGCLICKSRRIKCDEKKPNCGPCCNRNLVCTYSFIQNVQKIALWPGKKSPQVLTEASAFSSDRDLELLHHFYSVVGRDLMLYPNGSIPSKGVSDIILHNAHTMHVALAVAAIHRRVTVGKSSQSLEEMSHWTQALNQFRHVLGSFWDDKADAILTTSMFLNLMTFIDTRPQDDPSIFSEPPTFQWLRIQTGISELLVRVSARGTSTLWLPFWQQAAPNIQGFYDERSGPVGIPSDLADLFEINERSTCDEHPYLRPLRRICALLPVERTSQNVMLFVQFVQGVDNQFMDLLDMLDPRAMIILSHWLACLTCVELWWCVSRTHNTCKSICAYIDLHYPEMNSFLEYPADCCGYEFHYGSTPEISYLIGNGFTSLLPE